MQYATSFNALHLILAQMGLRPRRGRPARSRSRAPPRRGPSDPRGA